MTLSDECGDTGENSLLPKNIDFARSYEKEADYFFALGIGSAALLHRLHNTLGVLGPNLLRLRKHLDYCANNREVAAYSAIQEVVSAMEKSIRISDSLIASLEGTLQDEPPSPVDINSILHEVRDQVSTSEAANKMFVSLDLREDVPPVYADRGLIAEVFRTVLENSFKAVSEETGQIAIRSRYQSSRDVVQVEIQDNGSGIPRQILTKLFRGPVASSEANHGLGLWLARLMLSRLGGEIWVKHTGIGLGTTIAITLPVANASTMKQIEGDHV
jgi:two-component system, NtrC family, sensor kinase